MLKTFATRFAKQANAQPEVLMEALKEFMEETTGRTVDMRFETTEAQADDAGRFGLLSNRWVRSFTACSRTQPHTAFSGGDCAC